MGIRIGAVWLASILSFPAGAQELETLHGIDIDRVAISVTVTSNGCTRTEDFRVDVALSKLESDLAIYRLKPDHCRQVPQRVTLSFGRASSGVPEGAALRVKNPFASE